MDTYYFYFAVLIIFSIFGVYIYFKKGEKFNRQEVLNLFLISCGLRVFDFISTIYFTSKLGIDMEGNILARILMYMFGTYAGLFICSAFLIPLTFFLFVAVNYSTRNGIAWKIFKIIVIITGIMVPIINFASTNIYK